MTLTDMSVDRSSLILSDEFAAISPEMLFRYWTEPALLTRWWPRAAEIEPWEGGAYALSWPDAGWRLVGRYTAFEQGRYMAFTWSWVHEPDAPETMVTLRFEPRGEDTRLALTHGRYDETPEGQEMRAGHLEGWTHFLGRLHETVQG